MIKRVFSYSITEVIKNGNDKHLENILGNIIGGSYILVAVVMSASLEVIITYIIIATIVDLILLKTLLPKIKRINKSKLTGFAIDNNNRIYRIYYSNVNASVTPAIENGIINGKRINKTKIEKHDFLVRQARASMENPAFIARCVEEVPNIPGVEVDEILKVFYIEESSHYYKITCSYRILGINTIKNETIYIYKSYNTYTDLINMLRSYQ